jgi:FdrA protein
MATGVVIKRNRYFDSVFLMQVARSLQEERGVLQAVALMGTESNRRLLAEMGFAGTEIAEADANDLIIALQGKDQEAISTILDRIDEWLTRRSRSAATPLYTLDDALDQQPLSNLVAISVPGQYAGREARKALERGLNVFLFSSNVPVEEEIALKEYAREHRLIVMGPDCGTAILAGVGIGFANAVRRGPIGVIGPSGTGLQEFTCIVHQCGSGISHAIGTGGRDLSDAVGGITTLQAFDVLEADADTSVLCIVSKPPGPATLARLIRRVSRSRKPIVVCFLGAYDCPQAHEGSLEVARTLDEAASRAVKLATGGTLSYEQPSPSEIRSRVARERAGIRPGQKYIRGVFAGGTFCYQAQQIMLEGGLTVYSNAPIMEEHALIDPHRSVKHSLIDMGAEFFTEGRPHPMIDPSLRRGRILAEAQDPEVAVLLLDFILGYSASPDPAGDLKEVIIEAKRMGSKRGAHLAVVASVCGTDSDPQNMTEQILMLEEAGAVVLPNAALAATFSRELAMTLEGGKQ